MELIAQTGDRAEQGSECGTSMLEMVIVLPLLLLLLFALVEFGLLFGRWLVVNNAAREGAREAILFRADCDPAAVESQVISTVQSYTSSLGLSILAGDISVDGVCGGTGSMSTVAVTLPFNFQVLGAIAPSIGPTVNLPASSAMRNEG
jgi:Flp pilus assembly protein TadG